LAPITPFITEYLWKILYSKKSIHKEQQVESESSSLENFTQFTKEITEFNSKVWNEKKSKELSLKDSIAVPVPENLSPFSKDFAAMHNLK
jgi:valyl-tRNA synthetase